MKQYQVIRSMTDANLLLDRGHQIVKIDRDARNRRYLVFYFINSQQLQTDLREITLQSYAEKYRQIK